MTDRKDGQADILPKEEKNFIGGLLRFTFFVVAFFAIIFTVMANMGGSSEALKQSAENIVSDALGGRPAHVERLVRMSFFPLVGFDAEGIEVLLSAETGDVALRVDKVRAFTSFWDVVRKKPQFRMFLIENLRAEEGVLGRKAFSIEKAFVDHNKGDNMARIRAYGQWDQRDWDFSLGVKAYGSNPKFSYLVDTDAPFFFDVDDLALKGVMKDRVEDYIRIEDFSLEVSGREFLAGAFSFSRLEHNMLKFRGDVVLGQGKSSVHPDIVVDFSKNVFRISGDIEGKTLVLTDLRGENALKGAYARIEEVLGWDRTHRHDIDIKMAFQDVRPSVDTQSLGPLSFKIVREGGAVSLSSVRGGEGETMEGISCPENKEVRKDGQAEESEAVTVPAALYAKLDGILNFADPANPCHGLIRAGE